MMTLNRRTPPLQSIAAFLVSRAFLPTVAAQELKLPNQDAGADASRCPTPQ
jgi:hypothetical protein